MYGGGCPLARLGTFVAIGQQDAGHEALLAVSAKSVPDEDLISCQLLLQHQRIPPVKLGTQGWDKEQGLNSARPTPPSAHRALLSQNPPPTSGSRLNVGCKQDWQGGLSPGKSLQTQRPRLCSLPRQPLGSLRERAHPGPTDSRPRASDARATRGPYVWRVGSVSSRPSLQTQDEKITLEKSLRLHFHPPHPTPVPALTSQRRRGAPGAQEEQEGSAI